MKALAPLQTYHPDIAARCSAEALSLPCTDVGYDTLWSDCLLAFEAKVAVDGTCHSDFECQAGLTCNGACASWEVTSCCIGACTAKNTTTSPQTMVFVEDGEACSTTDTACANITSHCGTSGVCAPRLAVGSACSYDDACIGYAFCNGGKCQKKPSLGEKCKLPTGGFARCLPGGCDRRLCDDQPRQPVLLG